MLPFSLAAQFEPPASGGIVGLRVALTVARVGREERSGVAAAAVFAAATAERRRADRSSDALERRTPGDTKLLVCHRRESRGE